MSRTHYPRRLAVVAAAGASLVLVGAAPAAATVVERGSYSDRPYSFETAECGFDVLVQGVESGQYRIRAGKGDLDTAFFLRENRSFTETWTNEETGAFLTISGHSVFNEVKATHVSGNLFVFESVEAGQPAVIRDSTGKIVARDRGVFRHSVLFDTLGDDQPGGEVKEEYPSEVHGPHPVDADFCGIVTRLIGS